MHDGIKGFFVFTVMPRYRASISLDSKVQQNNEDIVCSSTGDEEVVMLSIEQGLYFGLDSIGSAIWNIISEPVTVSEIVDHLLGRFSIDRPTCERDVVAFLTEMTGKQIIRILN